jgi:hypothetical protein
MPDAAHTSRCGRFTPRRSFLRSAVAALAFAAASPAFAAEPAMPAGLSAPAKPTAMPVFDLPTTHGETLSSTSLAGQVLVIRFWASW